MITNHNDIKAWLDLMYITNYTIHDTGTVTVDGDVSLYQCGLNRIPVQFRIVYGFFDCSNNYLETLEGCPREVGGDFSCAGNKLKSLEGGPIEVGEGFYCNANQLTTLEGSPREVGGGFICSDNNLTSLEGSPIEVGEEFHCWRNRFDCRPTCASIILGEFRWTSHYANQ